jgi:hypothetical protein
MNCMFHIQGEAGYSENITIQDPSALTLHLRQVFQKKVGLCAQNMITISVNSTYHTIGETYTTIY